MRLVVKVGTNVLTKNLAGIQFEKIRELTGEIFELQKHGHEVILVSSGAVASGRAILPKLNTEYNKQVWAALGQPQLMDFYRQAAKAFGLAVAQCLVLRSDFTDKERYTNFIHTLRGLLSAKTLPIINENDVMSTADLTVGDNDLLAAMVAAAIGADKLVLLTNQKGLYTSNPDSDPGAQFVAKVTNVDYELEKLCSRDLSTMGRGGMLSKVRAAKHALNAGIEAYIGDGREPAILLGFLDGKNFPGTRFVPSLSREMSEHKRWLMSAKGWGQLIIDEGAAKALLNNKSLLLPGIIDVKGVFDKGEIVEVIAKNGAAVAYGKVNYDNKEIQTNLVVRKTKKQHTLPKEVIHHDHMVVLKT